VLWCPTCETALAEAEVEYKDKTSPSVYVAFPVTEGELKGAEIAIWTTTPWTLPANRAAAFHPTLEYVEASATIAGRKRRLIVAKARWESVAKEIGAEGAEVLRSWTGEKIVALLPRYALPYETEPGETGMSVLAEYVTAEDGTGVVHTAPGHGVDDFHTGQRYSLQILNPVDASGRFTDKAPRWTGKKIFEEGNPEIIADLKERGWLLAKKDIIHSYPHCWRCKNPVVFRATAQWFISMDGNNLRRRIVGQLPEVTFTPGWGEERMTQMIENHPEWCLSRQRTWGTPIPAMVCNACQESILDPAVARIVAERFRNDGAGVWWTDPAEAFLPPGFTCPKCAGTTFTKEMNIVDIWFESGVTHRAVLEDRGMPWPADVYLEGGDQYRGWFRSSLVTAVATKDHPPYKQVVATGWVVDQDGRAMHKSAGNYIGAVDGMEKYGADVLRLWVASVEYTADVRLGAKLLENVANVYRNLRNRFRWYLGSVDDLTPETVVPREAMEPLDRLVLAKLDAVTRDIVVAYREFRLHDAYLALQRFDGDDLSAFYVDALKDRLYTSAPDSSRRRSAQSAVLEIFRTVAVLTAPILSFTAEEAWQALPVGLRGGAESIFDVEFPKLGAVDIPALELWDQVRALRAQVAAAEGERDFQLDAEVTVPAAQLAAYQALGDGLREALVVSSLRSLGASADGGSTVKVMTAAGEKCERCWKYLPLGSDAEHPTLCAPCAAIVRS
jgi:isoleucyl-tRNA synthetase